MKLHHFLTIVFIIIYEFSFGQNIDSETESQIYNLAITKFVKKYYNEDYVSINRKLKTPDKLGKIDCENIHALTKKFFLTNCDLLSSNIINPTTDSLNTSVINQNSKYFNEKEKSTSLLFSKPMEIEPNYFLLIATDSNGLFNLILTKKKNKKIKMVSSFRTTIR